MGLAISVSAASAAPPAGATARCRDGGYSFSKHHSGSCSRHGGVAVWLDGGAAALSGPSTVAVGHTVLLAPQTRTGICRVGSLPDRRCSPGAYYSKLTKAVLCSSSFHTSSVRSVPVSAKHQVEVAYGMQARPYGSTLEIDHIVSLELGGSNDAANLYPEKATYAGHAPGFRVKDKLENAAHRAVCAGTLSLRSAQQQIARDWKRLYKKLFTVVPTG